MSYSCLRHQYYSPKDPCGACTRERDMQMMGQSNQAAAYARMQAQSRWPQDVFERLEKERDVAVTIAARLRVALEKVQAFAKRDEHWEILNECEGALESTDT